MSKEPSDNSPILHPDSTTQVVRRANPLAKRGLAIANDLLLLPVPITTAINPIDGAEMLWIPGATFTMGSATGVGDPDECPAHQVTLTGYWIYKYAVTVAQYRAFCAATGHEMPPWPGDQYSWTGKTGWDDPALQQHPIVIVCWNDAKAYADWAGVTLPTEAQWEYAARGPQGRNYPWGGTATKYDNYNGWDATKCGNYENTKKVGISTWPVGSFPAGASWCGALDMAGNVWQWCGDWYRNYDDAVVTDPTGPGTGKYRVLRGGSWTDTDPGYFRAAVRLRGDPAGRFGSDGFRCVLRSPGPFRPSPSSEKSVPTPVSEADRKHILYGVKQELMAQEQDEQEKKSRQKK